MPQKDMNKLAKALEQIFLRDRIIGTRANLVWRLNECFQKMDNSAVSVVNHIQWMKNRNDWWGYWNNDEFITYSKYGNEPQHSQNTLMEI